MMTNIKISRISTIGSFGIGSVLLLSYFVTNTTSLLFIGFYYVIFAFLLNITILLLLILSVLYCQDKYIEYLKAIGFMLVNIPVTFFYLFILGLL